MEMCNSESEETDKHDRQVWKYLDCLPPLTPDVCLSPGWQELPDFQGAQNDPSALSESLYLQIFATKT